MTDILAVTRSLDERLPDLARSVVRAHLEGADPSTHDFLQSPDAREHHQTDWHQWGIITHTRVFMHHYEVDVPRYLKEWGLWQPVSSMLAERIDGVGRGDLLRVAILLHDIGKFGARTRGKNRFHFSRHEELSGRVIREEIDFDVYELTHAQIEYIAMTAEDHFVLGQVRKRAREDGAYGTDFVRGHRFLAIVREIRNEHPRDFVEIGVLFLGDSLAKADPACGPERAVRQYYINIDLAHAYLNVVLGNGQS